MGMVTSVEAAQVMRGIVVLMLEFSLGRECIIVLHSKVTRGTFLPAPYIDEYGETDKGLKRGNPLTLDPEKYEELNRMWLRNEIPEKIARMFDPDMLLYFEWHPL